MVTGIDMREERISSVEAKRAGEESLLLIDRVSRVLTTVPVGTLDVAGTFERGEEKIATDKEEEEEGEEERSEKREEGEEEGEGKKGKGEGRAKKEEKRKREAGERRHAAMLGENWGGKRGRGERWERG